MTQIALGVLLALSIVGAAVLASIAEGSIDRPGQIHHTGSGVGR